MSSEPPKDAESGSTESPDKETEPVKKKNFWDPVFGEDYCVVEVRFTIFAAILIALNNGFVNGVTMSALLSENEPTDIDPGSAMVSGVAGYITNSATFAVGRYLDKYRYNVFMFLFYMLGASITAIISPNAKPYAVDPGFGPSFMIGGTMLLGSSLLSMYGSPTRWIYYLAICANGVQNGVASIYSANLIRCTLTGAITDIGLVLGQMLRGNFSKVGKGSVLAIIVICFWIGGIIAFPAVRAFEAHTLFINAGIFYLVGLLNVFYLVSQLNIGLLAAATGQWDWKDVLNKIKPSGDKQSLMDLFDELDQDNGGTIDMYELQKGLKGKVSAQELDTLLKAADSDNSGDIDEKEWKDLVDELFILDEHAAVGRMSMW
jgi:hypothetical protein